MPVLEKKRQCGPTNAQPSRPNLTLDTQAHLNPTANDASAQSAPVGTRQERGIAPMYQAGDRHCAKLAEMMDSPTWRGKNLLPYMECHQVQRPMPLLPPPTEETVQATSQHKKCVRPFVGETGIPAQNSQNGCRKGEVLHLGLYGDDIEILGIQPFREAADNSSDTFIISAAIAQKTTRPYQNFRDDNIIDCEDAWHSPTPSDSSPREVATWPQQEMRQILEDNAQQVMEQDDAIQSINNSLRSPGRRRQATSDEQQRFKGLLDRLHQRRQGEDSKNKKDQAAPFVDPAIIAFVPKKADPGTSAKRSTRHRSDSGYASPSIYSRPSTRAQSRSRPETCGSDDPEFVHIEHQKDESKDSGFDESPSKHSLLNPTATEFSIPSTSKASPIKKALPTRSSVLNRVFEPSLQVQEMLGALSASQTFSPVHSPKGTWYPPQPNFNVNNPSMPFASLQQGVVPGMLQPWSNITAASMPSAAGITSAGLHSISGPIPCLAQTPGFGLAGLTMSPGIGAANVSGPFHQQLSSLGMCCNPTHHQTMSAFSPPAFHGLVPPVLPSQTPAPPLSLAKLTPSAVPFIPKHVPKPKVPNTTGQQNWELMHELRRMNEPGYAQRCKEKQKKRYMKQLEKTGCQS